MSSASVGYYTATVAPLTPVPTSAPTVTAIVPLVSQMIISEKEKSSLSLLVTLIKTRVFVGDISSGYLYCVAMMNGSAPSCVGSLKVPDSDVASSKNVVVTFPIGSMFPLTLSVTFTGLLASQTYAMYCYVETSLGTGNAFSEVLKTRTIETTNCCKTLAFTNSPLFIFGDVSKYTKSNTKFIYLFTFSLSSAPLISLQVAPMFKAIGSMLMSTDIVAIPSIFNFASTSQLTGQFLLSASSDISETYSISLIATGPSTSEYKSYTTIVQLLSNFSTLPAPLITSSRFSDSGQAVVITFDSSTDQAGVITISWACSLLFTFTGASRTTCTWVNTSAVSASFGVVTDVASNVLYLSTGDSVTLNGGLLKAFCSGTASACASNPVASTMSVITLGPLNPSAPTVIVNAPRFLSFCNDLLLDATGSYGNGGRLYNAVVWTVSASDTTVDVSAIQAYLNSASASYQVSRLFSISSMMLIKATYTFTLSLTNFIGLSNFISIVTVVTSDHDTPILTVIGPLYQNIAASTALTILSAATLSSCASQLTTVMYSWSVQKDGLSFSLTSISLDPTRFSLPAYMLAVDTSYLITITVSVGNSSSSASVTVFVTKGFVTAAVIGGLTRTAPMDKILTLDASISSDAAVSPKLPSTLAYKWTCTIGSLKNFGTDCGLFGNATTITTGAFTLKANIMALSTTYTFLVVVSSPDGRSASRTVSVNSVFSGAGCKITSSFSRFNVDSKLIIDGFISGADDVISEWSMYSSSGVVILFIALTPVTRIFSAIDAAAVIAYPLSIDGHTFSGGSSYSFRLSAYQINNPALRRFSEVTLTANSVPTGGSVAHTPEGGNALVTIFEITTYGWIADAYNFPLTFSFDYLLSATSFPLTVAFSSLRAFVITALPAGLDIEGHVLTVRATAVDIYLSSASAYSNIKVTMNKNTNISKVLANNLQSAFSLGDVNLAFQTINNIASSINVVQCAHSPNCLNLNRYNCSMTGSTCGSCFKYYLGVVGDSNTRCVNNSTIVIGTDDTACSANSDCLYDNCINGICTAPKLACPTNDPALACSGQGTCIYSNLSGAKRSNCNVFDTSCTATCLCSNGYGGLDCSLSHAQLVTVDSIR
jgi:hypothetical protein